MPRFIRPDDYLAVPLEFIQDKLPQANPTFVKVYIYLLMTASQKAEKSYSEIADTLGLLESDLMLAINYWCESGELQKTDDGIVFLSAGGNNPPSLAHHINETVSNDTQNISEVIENNKELSDMIKLAEEIMGKPITAKDMETLYWFHSELSMPAEVIVMLLEYCVSKGRARMSYIEKVAVSWKEMGLNDSESVALYLKSEEQKTGFLYSIRKVMGIADRSLSQMEEKYLTKWHDEYGMSEEMIALGYEYCIIQTAKLSFPYMDKIITRWHSEGITTIAAAEADNRRFKKKTNKSETAFNDTGYDRDDLERLTRNN